MQQRRRQRQAYRQPARRGGPAQHLAQLLFGGQQSLGNALTQSLPTGCDAEGALRKAGQRPRQPVELVSDDIPHSGGVPALLLPGKIAGVFPLQRGGQLVPAGTTVRHPRQSLRRDMILLPVLRQPLAEGLHGIPVVFLPAGRLVQTAPAVPLRHPVKQHFRIFGRTFLQLSGYLPRGGGDLPQRLCGLLQPVGKHQRGNLLLPAGGKQLPHPPGHRSRQQPEDPRGQQDLQKAGDAAGGQHGKKAVADGQRQHAAQSAQRSEQPAQQSPHRKAGDGKGKFSGGKTHHHAADHPHQCAGSAAGPRRRDQQQHRGRNASQ